MLKILQKQRKLVGHLCHLQILRQSHIGQAMRQQIHCQMIGATNLHVVLSLMSTLSTPYAFEMLEIVTAESPNL